MTCSNVIFVVSRRFIRRRRKIFAKNKMQNRMSSCVET